MQQQRLVLEGDTITCDYCHNTIGVIEYRDGSKFVSPSVLKHLKDECEVIHDEDEAIEEWRLERSFNGTGE